MLATTPADIYKYRYPYRNRNTCAYIDRYRPTKILYRNSTKQTYSWVQRIQSSKHLYEAMLLHRFYNFPLFYPVYYSAYQHPQLYTICNDTKLWDTYTSSKSLIEVAGVNASKRPMIYHWQHWQHLAYTTSPTITYYPDPINHLHISYITQVHFSCIEKTA